MSSLKLTEVIAVWEKLHTMDVGRLGFCDLLRALEEVIGSVQNDVCGCQTSLPAKPLLGLTPQWIVNEKKIGEIIGAMGRYSKAQKLIPWAWVAELHDLLASMEKKRS